MGRAPRRVAARTRSLPDGDFRRAPLSGPPVLGTPAGHPRRARGPDRRCWLSSRSFGGRRHHRVDARGVAPDDQLVNLRGALVQGGDAGIPEVTLDGIVVDI